MKNASGESKERKIRFSNAHLYTLCRSVKPNVYGGGVRLEMTWLAKSNLSRSDDHGVVCLARHPEFYIIFLVPVTGSCFYVQRCIGKEASWLWL